MQHINNKLQLVQVRKAHAKLCRSKNCDFDIAAAIREKWTVEQYEAEIAQLLNAAPLPKMHC